MNHTRNRTVSTHITTAKNLLFRNAHANGDRRVPLQSRRLTAWHSQRQLICKQQLQHGTIYAKGSISTGSHRHLSLFSDSRKSFPASTSPVIGNLTTTYHFSTDNSSSNNDTTRAVKQRKKKKMIPRKAAIALTPKARSLFKRLLSNVSNPEIVGVILQYRQSSGGEPRMVFAFDFVRADQLTEDDEGVSLEVLEDGTPKPPSESQDDSLPKLFVHHNAFMKVLGGTVDVEIDESGMFKPIMHDREGNIMDPNA